jgi:APA family basic amino acid/polyamine antiporter
VTSPETAPRPRRSRREHRLERVLGTPALFATAYGNVGSSIYYALGLTAAYALGLTPLVFVVAGIIFAATAATYAEGTVRYPEAGGSSSFARHAFNELVSFAAAWAQMLVYVVTVAVSAFFVPHYLSVFWEPLRENPADIVVGVIVIVVLVALNIVGVQEAAKLSVTLAVIDFATQVLLVILGFILVFSPEVIADNIHWGVAPTWSQLAIAIPVAMLAYTGVETVSNLAEEARDPARTVPAAYKWVAGAVFAIYFTLPLVALSAMPVQMIDGELTTLLALPPEEGGYANDPILGVVDNLGLTGTALEALQIYVGILAATILIIATNAGVIGASRITYSMATYRQMPELFRRLHPRFKTPWLSLVVFAGVAPILVILPGDTTFVGTLYSFGATLSFTVAHASIVRLRMKPAEEEEPYRARPNLRLAGVDWPVFAVLGGVATGISFVVILVQNAETRWVGLAWMAAGLIGYVAYRSRVVRVRMAETVKAPPVLGPAMALEYRTIVVPVVAGEQAREAMHMAARLAAERRSTIVAMRVIVVPLDLPLHADLPEQEALADDLLDEAHDIGDLYGVRIVERVVRGRNAGAEIVAEAERRLAEIIVMGAPRLPHRTRTSAIFGKTADYVLRNAPCRVMIAAARRAA